MRNSCIIIGAMLVMGFGCKPKPSGTEPAPANPDSGEVTYRLPTKPTEEFSSEGMVWIPAGEFDMGSQQGPEDEKPVHKVRLDGFWMGKHEVTNAEFSAYAKATQRLTVAERQPKFEELFPPEKHSPQQLAQMRQEWEANPIQAGSIVFTPPNQDIPVERLKGHNAFMQWWSYEPKASWRLPQGTNGLSFEKLMDHPVVHIAYSDAQRYCEWRTAVTGVKHRLPTEAEWEYAAHGGLEGKEFVWGDVERPEGRHMANTWQGRFPRENTKADGYVTTAPVGSYAANGYGLYDMAGNVWEWCHDWWSSDYYGKSVVKNPQGPPVEQSNDPNEPGMPKRVQRGGSFLCTDLYCGAFRPARRMKTTPDTGMSHAGFRIVAEGPPPPTAVQE